MDLSFIESLIPNIAEWLNVEPSTVLLMAGIGIMVANLIGRLIPDTAEGWLGSLRDLAKVVGAYVPNRVAKGVTVNDVTRIVAEAAKPMADGSAAEPVVPAFPGLVGKERLNENNDRIHGGVGAAIHGDGALGVRDSGDSLSSGDSGPVPELRTGATGTGRPDSERGNH